MKYVIMFTSRPDLDAAVPPERAQEVYGRLSEWFGEHATVITDAGAVLQPVTTATTVKHGASGPVVVDGPFAESKEVIGGVFFMRMATQEEAVHWASQTPFVVHGMLEIRELWRT